jgi:PBP1b-binding outer membrane lipoprotein LpoB
LAHFLKIITNNISEREHMTDKKQRLMLLFLLTLFLGGCSLFTDKAAERREMIQIAESQKMKVAIETYLKNLDPEALTPNGKIKSYRILKDKLKYNPMEGIIVEIVINRDDRLTIDMTVIEEDSGEYLVATSGTPKELTKLIERDKQ